ncbi:CoxG family protein [Trinickia dinghuensis]|uniref:Carbon monoxide dehydrogenase n=1 Tax=Trinickia dinghuensis TaxID=2291023 RepID=A0A3D8K0F1_9BURK|nr:SRPBCC domain-containing protein [Trinickia dinghuensis]RDU98325.1 carbon monoxide dehydrogenase [Trinickia dinghuensis]
MELTESYTLPVPPQRTWEALTDAAILRASIPGCEDIQADGENGFAVAVNPGADGVGSRFRGRVRLTEADTPGARTLLFQLDPPASGAVNGNGPHGARLRLEADGDASSTLLYTAYAQTLHADGTSPADDVVRKVADEFFKRFAAHLSAYDKPLPSDAPQAAGPSGQHAAVLESAPAGKGGKSWKAWTSRS